MTFTWHVTYTDDTSEHVYHGLVRGKRYTDAYNNAINKFGPHILEVC